MTCVRPVSPRAPLSITTVDSTVHGAGGFAGAEDALPEALPLATAVDDGAAKLPADPEPEGAGAALPPEDLSGQPARKPASARHAPDHTMRERSIMPRTIRGRSLVVKRDDGVEARRAAR